VEANLYDAGVVFEGPLSERWSAGAAFHRSYVDVMLDAFVPEDAPISFDVAPRYYDYQFLATRRGSGGDKLRLMFYGSLDKLRFLIDEPAADPKIRGNLDTRIMFHNLHAGYSSQLAEGLRQETSIVPGMQQVKVQMGPDIFFEMLTYRASLRSAWTLDLAKWVDLRAGVDARVDHVKIKVNATQPPKEGENPVPLSTMARFAIDKEVTALNAGLFSELRLRPVKGLLLLPSVRADRHAPLDRFTVDPRFAARYRGWPDTVFKLGLGLYSKQPQVDESDEDFGTPGLLAERALQLSAGVEQGLFELLELDVVLFYKWLDRVVTRNGGAVINPDAPRYTNEGTGRIFGVEVLLKLLEGQRLSGWVAYTFQRSFRTDGPDEEERLFDFDQPHILTVLGTYLLGRGWSVGLRYRLVSGNPSTPIVGSKHDAMSDTYVPVWGENNSERMGTFHQLDARVDKTWTFDTWRLQLYLDVQNVTNRGNPEGWEHSFDYTERKAITGLPILPVLGLKGAW
jgi:hypothetical protein